MTGTVAWLLALLVSCVQGGGHYLGASLNFQLLNLTDQHWNARVHGLLVWEAGRGPCQGGCDDTWVAKSTRISRDAIMAQLGNPRYFGTWSTEVTSNRRLNRPIQSTDITSFVNSLITTSVSDVNTYQGWVQENVFFDLQLKATVHSVDISLSGQSWHHLDYLSPSTEAPYYIQAKLTLPNPGAGDRLNSNPMGLTKPLHRVALQGVTEIEIFTQDRDDDIVTCSQAHFISAGGIRPLPGVSVSRDCRVRVEPALWGDFRDGGLGAVAVTLQDFKRENHSLSSHLALPLSSSSLQFVLETVAVLQEPVLVDPTPASGQHFIVYTGCQLSLPLYASPPSNSSTEVVQFTLTTMPPCDVTVSAVTKDATRIAQRVQHSMVTWTPTTEEAGDYVFLVGARDSAGNEAVARGYHIHVKAIEFVPVPADTNDGLFISFLPTKGSVMCTINYVCKFPLYISPSNSSDAVAEATLLNSTDVSGSVSSLQLVDLQGKRVYQGEATVTTHMEKSLQACFDIKTVKGASAVRCLNISQDPCSSEPCGNNGVCRATKSGHVCDCFPGWYGGLCDKDPCHASPCDNDAVCRLDGSCACKVGFEGDRCETMVDLCALNPDLCYRGRCVQSVYLLEGFVCQCEANWTGKHCDIDSSQNHSLVTSSSGRLPDSQLYTSVPVLGTAVFTNSHTMPFTPESSQKSSVQPDVSSPHNLAPTPTMTSHEIHGSSVNHVDSVSTGISPILATPSMSLHRSTSFAESTSVFSAAGSEQNSWVQQSESLQASFTSTPQPSQILVTESSSKSEGMSASSSSLAESLLYLQSEPSSISSTIADVSPLVSSTDVSKQSTSSSNYESAIYLHTSKGMDDKTTILTSWPSQASATLGRVPAVSESEFNYIQFSSFTSSKYTVSSIDGAAFLSSIDMPSSRISTASSLYSAHGTESLDMKSTLNPFSHSGLQPPSPSFSSNSPRATDMQSSGQSSWFSISPETISRVPSISPSSLVNPQTSFTATPEYSTAVTSNLGSSSLVLSRSSQGFASTSLHLSEEFKASITETIMSLPSHTVLQPSKSHPPTLSSIPFTTPSTTTEKTTTSGPKCQDNIDCALLQTLYGDICHRANLAERDCVKFCGLCKA